MVSMTIDMPEGALAAMRKDPVGFAHEMRLEPVQEQVRVL